MRAIRPVGFVDPRQAQWPADVLETAQADGSAEVIITLRGGSVFSTKAGSMSAKALKAQAGANQRAFDDILVDADTSSTSVVLASYADIGAIHARLSYDSVKRLYKKADSRILSIELNRPVAEATLTNSTGLMNMQSAWNAGYRAAGQSIIIVDSGIRKDHELFKMNGATKVTYEACFGTDAGEYKSICLSKDVKGDSPLGLSGSGEPYGNLEVCSTLATSASAGYHDCSHGTHVAGIAAGRKSSSVSLSNLQGVAPDAGLISAQVFSYETKNYKVSAFNADILAVLDAVLSATTAGTNNPYVVNLSMANNQIYSGDCGSLTDTQQTYGSIKNAIKSLTDRGVPIVTATGNDKNRTGIRWPACVPHTIKVSSVASDAHGKDLAEFANIGNPASFTGPILLAPGGGWGTSIKSADRASTTATKGIAGTSQAAPHVSGVYAAIKAAVPGISVADATNWIVNTGSIPVTVGTKTYRRIRIPNF